MVTKMSEKKTYCFSYFDRTYTLGEDEISYSPYLKTITTTMIPVLRHEDRIVLDDIPGSAATVDTYIAYLKGEPFTLEDEDAELFQYMGHNNPCGYPLDYWAVKLRETWIRDFYDSKELYREPFFGLQRVKLIPDPLPWTPPRGLWIAGGYALYLAGFSECYDDIDLFVTDEGAAREFIREHADEIIAHGPTHVDFKIRKSKVQLIFRSYRAPSEIVYGFDVDCVGLLYDPESASIWATDRALHAFQKRQNWLDPDRSSPSYSYRLAKYHRRGFDIMLPNFDPLLVRHSKIEEFLISAICFYPIQADSGIHYVSIRSFMNRLGVLLESGEHSATRLRVRPSATPFPTKVKPLLIQIDQSHIEGLIHRSHRILPWMLNDPVTILIMAKYYGLYPANIGRDNYDSGNGDSDEDSNGELSNINDFIGSIQWIRHQPGSQLSGSYSPTPFTDLDLWYRTSIVYGIATEPDDEAPRPQSSHKFAKSIAPTREMIEAFPPDLISKAMARLDIPNLEELKMKDALKLLSSIRLLLCTKTN